MSETALQEKAPVPAVQDGQLYLLSGLVQKDEALDQLTDFLKKSELSIKKAENLGAKSLFVSINKHNSLTLVSVFFTAEPAVAAELGQTLRHEEYLERFLITSWRGPIDAPMRHERSRKPVVAKVESGETA